MEADDWRLDGEKGRLQKQSSASEMTGMGLGLSRERMSGQRGEHKQHQHHRMATI